MTFKLMAERCAECLYGPNKIVSNARRSQIIRDITRKDSHFICHKASIAEQDVACRGDWDQRGCGQLGRIMGRLNAVTFVEESSLSVPSNGSPDHQSDVSTPETAIVQNDRIT